MFRVCRWRWAMGLAAVLAAVSGHAAEKIAVLIIDGQHHAAHPWKLTTPVIQDALLKTGRFTVDVATTPDAKAPKEDWEKFSPDPSKYGAVLINYHGQPWPKEVNAAFEKYMQDGGGLVFYHAAVFSFERWAEWNKMMGMGWRAPGFGDRVILDDEGKIVRIEKGKGPGGGHGPAHAFEVINRAKDHPVMKGLPEKWMHVSDELYHGMRGPCEDMTILATAYSSNEKGKGGTGCHEPMVWTVSYGKGRVFVSALGHAVPQTTAADTAALLCRGTEWAATGEVTIPVPADFSAPAKADAK